MTLVALAPLAGAVEGDSATHVADIRMGLGFGPLPKQSKGILTESPADPTLIGMDDISRFDRSPGLAVTLGGVVGSLDPVGLLLGGEIRYFNGEQQLSETSDVFGIRSAEQIAADSGDRVPDLSYSQAGLAGLAGVGVAVNRAVHLEFLAIAGLDWVTMDLLANRGSANLAVQKGQGPGYTLGGRVGAYWTDAESAWQFGLEGEWLFTRSELKTSYVDVTNESVVFNRGISIRGVLGHRF